MKTCALIAGIAMLLATGAAHAIEYDCGLDTVRILREPEPHNDFISTVIRIEGKLRNRKGPVVRYDVQKDKLTVDGKRCKGSDK
jgi:hypothetical protein